MRKVGIPSSGVQRVKLSQDEQVVGQDFLYVFELTMVNACFIFQECNGNIARLKRHPATFQNDLITGLTAGYSRPVKCIGRPIALAAEDRLSEHDHKLVPIPGRNCKFEPNSEDCKVCSDKGQVAGRPAPKNYHQVQQMSGCDVCVSVFDRYHTPLNYQTCCKDYEMKCSTGR